jgi:hypothetical protein
VMISTRSGALVIDTVVCLTLAKWETVSGQFGGYLRIFDYKSIFGNDSHELDKSSNGNICGSGAGEPGSHAKLKATGCHKKEKNPRQSTRLSYTRKLVTA